MNFIPWDEIIVTDGFYKGLSGVVVEIHPAFDPQYIVRLYHNKNTIYTTLVAKVSGRYLKLK